MESETIIWLQKPMATVAFIEFPTIPIRMYFRGKQSPLATVHPDTWHGFFYLSYRMLEFKPSSVLAWNSRGKVDPLQL